MAEIVYSSQVGSVPVYLDSIEDRGTFYIVRLKGPINATVLETNRAKMTEVIKRVDLYRKSILCDLGKATFGDSATVAALISRMSDFKKRDDNPDRVLVFYNLPKQFRSYFDIVRASRYLVIRDTEAEALALVS